MLHLLVENGDLAPVLLQRINTKVFRMVQSELYLMKKIWPNQTQSKECLLNDNNNILADTQTLYRRLLKSTTPKLSLLVISIRFFELDCHRGIAD